MKKFFYDLHIHSALSPCADNAMTPATVAGIAALNGLNICALTDHNSCGNVSEFFKACRAYGVVPVAGMELETAESIHVVCLFPALKDALDFWGEVKKHMMPVKNKPAIFGEQFYMDCDDNVVGVEDTLLITSTALSLSEGIELVKKYGGSAFPAHIDRPSNGIIEILGDLPPDCGFTAVEFNDGANIEEYGRRYAAVGEMKILVNSDAHRVENINASVNGIELDCEDGDEESIRRKFFEYIGK